MHTKEIVMAIADRHTYLRDVVNVLLAQWPSNRTVNIVCHGHSVPAGYFATPMVDTFNAYPELLHRDLKHRFPFAVINVIVTAIGGEDSPRGAGRFETEVLCHRPDVVTIDYGLNDRGAGLPAAETAWRSMIEACWARQVKVLLLTPTWDNTGVVDRDGEAWRDLARHSEQIRCLAAEYETGLVDSFAAFQAYVAARGDPTDLLSWSNHPNRRGHELVARELLRWFAIL
jgi:lysophospholipase L1-like esterase